MMTTSQAKLLKELRGTVCAPCGAWKGTLHPFCASCYMALDVGLRERLYREAGRAYEQAHAEALEVLRKQSEAA
jgi:hypothetical protein